MFWGFETDISSPSPQIAGGICLSKTSSLGQIIIANISLDVSIAPTGFSLSITWYRKESQVLTWFLILQDAFFLQTPSAQSAEGNPFLAGSLRNPVYGGCIRGRRRGCVHLLVVGRATSPGVCQARATCQWAETEPQTVAGGALAQGGTWRNPGISRQVHPRLSRAPDETRQPGAWGAGVGPGGFVITNAWRA